MPRAALPELRLRLTIEGPVPGVALRMQRGADALTDPVASSAKAVVFEFSVTVADAARPRFTGPFAQGPADARFVYVCVGARAGQHDSPWSRRIKVPLGSITPEAVTQALAGGKPLAARILGTGRDGTPACATVPLLQTWSLD